MESQKDFMDKTGYLFSQKTDNAWSDLREKIEQEEEDNKRPFLYTSWAVRVAAGLIILLGFAWGIRNVISTRVEKIETASSQRQVKLPDGSIAYLNYNSQLTYPKTFGAQSRKVTLQGEAFFKVTKNPLKTFIVETKSAQVKVLGTSFSVNAPGDKDQVDVYVKTGIVSLSPNLNGKDKLFLKKGEFGMMQEGKTKRIKAPGVNYLSWQTKRFLFKNETLKNVSEVLNHAYNTSILFDTDSIGQLRLTSTYNQVSLETVVKSLCLTFHLKANQKGNEIILSANN